jgi:hypothetical protein
MMTKYDRHAKNLWVKVYQDAISNNIPQATAKTNADIAVSDYMSSIHGDSVVKENLTSGQLTYLNGLNDQKAIDKKELDSVRKERDNYYDRLQELRKENADLAAENERLKEHNKYLDVAYQAGVIDGKRNQSVDSNNMIEVLFELDSEGDVRWKDDQGFTFYEYCRGNNIDQTRIKRILLEMKDEDE